MGLPFLLLILVSAHEREAPARELTGFVLDATGRAVPEAVVLVRGEERRSAFEPPRTARCDAEGRFRVEPGSGESFAVTAFAPGFAVSSRQKIQAGEVLQFELSRGLAVSGVVLDARTKDPLAGVRVETYALPPGAMPPPDLPWFGRSGSESDGRGRFQLTGLQPGPVNVTATARGYGRVDIRAQGGAKDVQVFLTPGAGSLHGVVLSSEGEPLEGASVAALVPGGGNLMPWSWGPRVETDEKGRFEILGLRPDVYRILAFHPDKAFRILPEVLVQESEILVDEVRLAEGLRLEGQLVDEDGEPLEGEIQVESIDGEGRPYFLSDRMLDLTDARGRFDLEKLAPGEYGLVVQPKGYPAERVTALLETRDVDLGSIVIDRGLTIAGVVLDAGGQPVENASVYASIASGLIDRMLGGAWENATAETATDGSFSLRGLEEGSYRLSADAPGHVHPEPATVEAGAADVVLILKRAGAISGVVVDSEGMPVTSYHVVIESVDRSSGRQRRTFSSSDGRFLVEGLEEGAHALTIDADGLKPGRLSRISVMPGKTTDTGTIVLKAGGRIRGTVVSSEGNPIAGATATVIPSHLRTGVTSDARGAFELGGLEEGVIDLKVSHPDYADAVVQDIELHSEGSPVDVKVELGRGGSIEGLVRTRDGSPIPGRTVELESPRFRRQDTVTTGPDGSFRIERLPAGRHRLHLLSADPNVAVRLQERVVEVEEGETSHVVFESRQIRVYGHVTKGSVSVPDAHVSFRPAGGSGGIAMMTSWSRQPPSGPMALNALTGPDGFYELYVDGPGEYSAGVTASDGFTAFPEKDVTIPDRDSHVADLNFTTVTVSGNIVAQDSEEPVAGARVEAFASVSEPVARSRGFYRTDGDGRFRLELDPGRYRIHVQADGFSPEEKNVDVSEDSAPDVTVALGRGGRIRGRVLDANGNDPGRYYVHAVEDEGPTTDPPRFSDWAEIHPDGAFELRNLAPRRYNLLAGSDLLGFAFAPGVAPGEELTLQLRPASRVHLTVLDADGAPVAGARVAVSAISGRKVRGVFGRTDAAGKAELFAPAGSLEIKVVQGDTLEGVIRIAAQENARTETGVVLSPVR